MNRQAVLNRPSIAFVRAAMVAAVWASLAAPALAGPATLVETPMLRAEVDAKKLPPVKQRLPDNPLVVTMDGKATELGQHGGTLNMLIGRARDVRMMMVYGYARLVGYDANLKIVPDMLESIDVKDERIFTMKLRKGHKWSDGHPLHE